MNTAAQTNYQGRPAADEYASFYGDYIQRVEGERILEQLAEQSHDLVPWLKSLDENQVNRLHPPYHWTIKQVLGHLIDAEKAFGYRAHRFAVGDATELAGYDHDRYVSDANYDQVSFDDLVDEWAACRRANQLFYRRLTPESWMRRGTANEIEVSVRALAYLMVGHVNHHVGIIRQRVGEHQNRENP